MFPGPSFLFQFLVSFTVENVPPHPPVSQTPVLQDSFCQNRLFFARVCNPSGRKEREERPGKAAVSSGSREPSGRDVLCRGSSAGPLHGAPGIFLPENSGEEDF